MVQAYILIQTEVGRAADVSDTQRDFGWEPKVTVEQGIPLFVDWFKAYNRL